MPRNPIVEISKETVLILENLRYSTLSKYMARADRADSSILIPHREDQMI